MKFTRQLAMQAYYHATSPYRLWSNLYAMRQGKAPVMVLFYHRVADEYPNDWTISRQQFGQQIAWLQENVDLVSLEEAQSRIHSGHNDRPCVSITFDDGYAENCQHALPLLIKWRIPCTYFVTVQNCFDGTPFPHDVAAGQPLAPNTLEQLKALSGSGVEIGAHTRTHADLGQLHDPAKLTDEIVTAGEELQLAIGAPVRYFAFPFGMRENLNSEAFHLAHEAGYEAVCSAYGGYNFPGNDSFHLQRFHADPELIRLKNWVTVDPRKRNIPRYQYEDRATDTTSIEEAATS